MVDVVDDVGVDVGVVSVALVEVALNESSSKVSFVVVIASSIAREAQR